MLISGTASINNKGEIKYPKNIVKQTERMWANIEALLNEADCTYQDVCQMIVYLRDNSDYMLVKEMFDMRFRGKPYVIVQASLWKVPYCSQSDKPLWI